MRVVTCGVNHIKFLSPDKKGRANQENLRFRYVLLFSLKFPCEYHSETHLCNRPSIIYILTGFSEKNITGSLNFPQGCPCLSGRCFASFKHT